MKLIAQLVARARAPRFMNTLHSHVQTKSMKLKWEQIDAMRLEIPISQGISIASARMLWHRHDDKSIHYCNPRALAKMQGIIECPRVIKSSNCVAEKLVAICSFVYGKNWMEVPDG